MLLTIYTRINLSFFPSRKHIEGMQVLQARSFQLLLSLSLSFFHRGMLCTPKEMKRKKGGMALRTHVSCTCLSFPHQPRKCPRWKKGVTHVMPRKHFPTPLMKGYQNGSTHDNFKRYRINQCDILSNFLYY